MRGFFWSTHMEFLEYPKALYQGDVMRVVPDAEEEAAARRDGFAVWGEQPAPPTADKPEHVEEVADNDPPPAKRKYTRKVAE